MTRDLIVSGQSLARRPRDYTYLPNGQLGSSAAYTGTSTTTVRPEIALNHWRGYDPLSSSFLSPDPADLLARHVPRATATGETRRLRTTIGRVKEVLQTGNHRFQELSAAAQTITVSIAHCTLHGRKCDHVKRERAGGLSVKPSRGCGRAQFLGQRFIVHRMAGERSFPISSRIMWTQSPSCLEGLGGETNQQTWLVRSVYPVHSEYCICTITICRLTPSATDLREIGPVSRLA